MTKVVDLTGRKFFMLEAIAVDPNFRGQGAGWVCRCDCGTVKTVRAKDLRSKNTLSCGCHRKIVLKRGCHAPWKVQHPRFIDETGNGYGRLTVLEYAGRGVGKAKWRCICECGTVKLIEGASLRAGLTRSCGCLMREIARANLAAWKSLARRSPAVVE